MHNQENCLKQWFYFDFSHTLIIKIIETKKYEAELYFETACSAGFYSPDCRQTCGNCLDVIKCLHTNGVCLTGCDVGYQGALCKTRELIF